jgi:hypothetical protein
MDSQSVYSIPPSVSNDDDDYYLENHAAAASGSSIGPPPVRHHKDDMDTNNHNRTTTTTTLPNAYVGGNDDADKIAYLIRYETMVRQQEAEDMAVWAHVGPCMVRLMALIHSMEQHPHDHMPSHDPSVVPPHVVLLQEEVSFVQLKLALQALEALSPGRFEIHRDTMTTPKAAVVVECMTTDRQLMMILRLLTQKVVLDTDTSSSTSTTNPMIGLTWAEFVQCYKICIIGMITLQHLPIPSSSSSSVTTAASVVRTRARDRTLAMLSLFECPSTQLFHQLLPSEHHHDDDDDVLVVANNRSNVPANAPVRMTHTRNERNSYRHHNVQYDENDDTSSPTKPRPWFKKRTQRILPYLIVIMVSLVGIVPIWYQRRQLLLSSQQPTRDDTTTTTTTVVQPSVTRRNRNDLPTIVTTSSLWFLPPTTTTWTSPSSSPQVVGIVVHDPPERHTGTTSSSSSLPTLEKQKHHPPSSRYSVPRMIHPIPIASSISQKKNPTQYHPLLGIWSNFMP